MKYKGWWGKHRLYPLLTDFISFNLFHEYFKFEIVVLCYLTCLSLWYEADTEHYYNKEGTLTDPECDQIIRGYPL